MYGKDQKSLIVQCQLSGFGCYRSCLWNPGWIHTPWMEEFSLTATQVGWIVGTAFWGFTIAMVIFGPLVDIIGFLGGAIAQPSLGKIYDIYLAKFANDHLAAGAASLRTVIILTVFLTAAFLFLFLKYRNSKN